MLDGLLAKFFDRSTNPSVGRHNPSSGRRLSTPFWTTILRRPAPLSTDCNPSVVSRAPQFRARQEIILRRAWTLANFSCRLADLCASINTSSGRFAKLYHAGSPQQPSIISICTRGELGGVFTLFLIIAGASIEHSLRHTARHLVVVGSDLMSRRTGREQGGCKDWLWRYCRERA